MVKICVVLAIVLQTSLADYNQLTLEDDKETRFLAPLWDMKRPGRGGAGAPAAAAYGARCSERLETALDHLRRRKRNQPKTIDGPQSETIELNGYSVYQKMRSAPVDMHVTRMRVRLPPSSEWVRVQRCQFEPRNKSLDTTLLFQDLTISGNVDLYGAPVDVDRKARHADYRLIDRSRPSASGCNMILRLRKAGIGFHTRPLQQQQQPGKFNVKTDSEFVEPGFISVYAYGCERYVNRNSIRHRDELPLRRRRRSDQFSFRSNLEEPEREGRVGDWDVYEAQASGSGYDTKHYRPDDQLDEAEEISREMEDIFTKGIRTLLTTYMKKELQPAIKETLMRNMGYVISYG